VRSVGGEGGTASLVADEVDGVAFRSKRREHIQHETMRGPCVLAFGAEASSVDGDGSALFWEGGLYACQPRRARTRALLLDIRDVTASSEVPLRRALEEWSRKIVFTCSIWPSVKGCLIDKPMSA